jgi:hypothetical protein
MSDLRYPIKLNDDYTCQGIDADGKSITFTDLLHEGARVGPFDPEDCESGEPLYESGVVVAREDGLWIEAVAGAPDA